VSSLSVPGLIPQLGKAPGADLENPYQSSGGRGVINLAAKFLMSLFPPNTPFFKFQVDPFALKVATKVGGDDVRDQVEKALVASEEAVQREIEDKGYRPRLHEALKHLIVAGNVIFYMGEKGQTGTREWHPRCYHLPSFVVRRCNDNIELIILCEQVSYDDLPEGHGGSEFEGLSEGEREKPVDLFTGCEWDDEGKKWNVWQEACSLEVAGSRTTYTEEAFPYIVLRGEYVSGEDYGRSYGEYHLGDLQSLEGLTQAIVEASAAAAVIKYLVDPNGLTDEKDLNGTPNGAFVPGREQDVHALQLAKYADLQVTSNCANAIKEDLAKSFLQNSAIQRQGERVTAEEIRYMAQELEQVLGGIYSLLSTEFQMPFIRCLCYRMRKEKRLPKMPSNVIKPTVVTGIEALGRGNDLNRLALALNVLKTYLGDNAAAMLNPDVLALRVFNASGVRDEGLVKTQDQQAAEAQQQQQAALVHRVAPNVVNATGAALQQQAEQQSQIQQQQQTGAIPE
jgi:hypothetical protein